MEKEIDYFTDVIAKLQRERIKTIEVKRAAVKDFDEYLEVRAQKRRQLITDQLCRLPALLPPGRPLTSCVHNTKLTLQFLDCVL